MAIRKIEHEVSADAIASESAPLMIRLATLYKPGIDAGRLRYCRRGWPADNVLDAWPRPEDGA